MVSIAGGAATKDSADPELIVSFGVQKGDLRDPSCVLYWQAPSTCSKLGKVKNSVRLSIESLPFLGMTKCLYTFRCSFTIAI
jgi:hypothetical protein